MGKLTTHILDTARGLPACNVKIELYNYNHNTTTLISTHITNDDGRVDTPLLTGAGFKTGKYQLLFWVEDYFKAHHIDAYFYDTIPLNFIINDANSHYHVPLLLSPYGYSTYRGS